MKNTKFKTIMKTLSFKENKNVDFPTERTENVRKLTVEEIKKMIKEEFEDVKDVEDAAEAAKEVPTGWQDAEIENEVDWYKALNIKEFLVKK